MKLLAIILLICSPLAWAEPLVLTSNNQPKTFIELYTSQGCSSCPPADNWLNRYKDNPDTFVTVLPMAFHVDYWDYLGWKDPFAAPAYAERQRDYARQGISGSVYTPQFVVNHDEWKGWFYARSVPDATPTVGTLLLNMVIDHVDIRYGRIEAPVHLAILGMGAVTQVNAGENASRSLPHDFVVIWHQGKQLNDGEARFQLPNLETRAFKRLAIAAWVGDRHAPPMQWVAGWLPEK